MYHNLPASLDTILNDTIEVSISFEHNTHSMLSAKDNAVQVFLSVSLSKFHVVIPIRCRYTCSKFSSSKLTNSGE